MYKPTALVFATLLALSPNVFSDTRIAYSKKAGVEVLGSDGWCNDKSAITFKADTSFFDGNMPAEFLKKVGKAVLPKECPTANSVTVTGLNKHGQKIYEGTAKKSDDWALNGTKIDVQKANPPKKQETLVPSSTTNKLALSRKANSHPKSLSSAKKKPKGGNAPYGSNVNDFGVGNIRMGMNRNDYLYRSDLPHNPIKRPLSHRTVYSTYESEMRSESVVPRCRNEAENLSRKYGIKRRSQGYYHVYDESGENIFYELNSKFSPLTRSATAGIGDGYEWASTLTTYDGTIIGIQVKKEYGPDKSIAALANAVKKSMGQPKKRTKGGDLMLWQKGIKDSVFNHGFSSGDWIKYMLKHENKSERTVLGVSISNHGTVEYLALDLREIDTITPLADCRQYVKKHIKRAIEVKRKKENENIDL